MAASSHLQLSIFGAAKEFVMASGAAVVDTLLDTARRDTELLLKNDALGDDFSVPRQVDFLLLARNRDQAELVSSFINDNRYGSARVEQAQDEVRVLVAVTMPTTQNILCSVSGLMACVAALFKVDYDGWGCVIQKR